jgi:alkylhydroperoxidase/carboxymuconolactone decarboxylase family protein YurZ
MARAKVEPVSDKANDIAQERRRTEQEFRKTSSVYETLVEQMGEVYGEEQRKDGLNQTQRILIALGMAVHSGSESSIDWTITRALNHGATAQMIRDAIDVALLNGGTFAVANARFALETLKYRLVTEVNPSESEFGPIRLPGTLGKASNF